MARLQGKVAIVTGAASGVGRADALLLAREGARVVLTDVNEDAGRTLAAEIGDAALFLRHDIAEEADWQRVMQETQTRFGPLDVLVNNAAILEPASIEDATVDQWRRLMRVNAEGYFLGCKAAVAAMKTRGGSIVNMSSVAAIGGLPLFCAYSATKGAVTALTRSVAAHCRQQNYRIRCNSIHPDGILTPMIAGFLPPDAVAGEGAAVRMCSPEDVASLVLFLASDESRFINGAELRIDNAQMIMGVA
jgi:3(or 17)beta-hydroxysteroid dehydrogenase